MDRRACLHVPCAAAWVAAAPAPRAQAMAKPPSEVLSEPPRARLQGSGRLRHFEPALDLAQYFNGTLDAPCR